MILESDINYQKNNNMKLYLTTIRLDKDSLLKADLQKNNLGLPMHLNYGMVKKYASSGFKR